MCTEIVVAMWSKSEPPKDGSTFCAIGRVVCSSDSGGRSSPFIHFVKWSQHGWVRDDGMSIATYEDERVCIDNWSPIPE